MLDKKKIIEEVLAMVKELADGKLQDFECHYKKNGTLDAATLTVSIGTITIRSTKKED